MKIYYPKSHYDVAYRGHVFPLLKAFIKNDSYTDAQRQKDYGISEKDFEIVDTVEKADIVILTMSWWYYKDTGQFNKAVSFIKEMNKQNIKVWTHIPGDTELDIPTELDIKVLVQQTYKSEAKDNVICYPPFIEDPLQLYFGTQKPQERTFNNRPVVGFCGYADSNKFKAIKDVFKTSLKNISYYLGVNPQKPHRLASSIYRRFKILDMLKNNSTIDSNFIIRGNYRAGLKNVENKKRHQTTIAFFQNINSSDYVLCYRGAGNFSIRFYQTLAMGRIPVFINTDCLLPFEKSLDWKNHVVWVEESHSQTIVQEIIKFHSNLDTETLNAICLKNRVLWESHFQLGSYFKTLFGASYHRNQENHQYE